MKVAILGTGKTGSFVKECLEKNENYEEFNSSNPLSLEKLKEFDVLIAFVSMDVLLNYKEILLDTKIPVISGATGQEYTNKLKKLVADEKSHWVVATNFSLGMRAIHQTITNLSKALTLFKDFNLNIHEVHHTKKLDAPSGTAKSWAKWAGTDNVNEITYDRTGDIVGDHVLTLNTGDEKITIRHEALNRKLFANGAVWAARYLLENKDNIPFGINYFEDITSNILNNEE